MAIAIKMRDELSPDVIDDSDFQSVIQALQSARVQGMEFLIMEKKDGFQKAFYLPNLNTIEESDAF